MYLRWRVYMPLGDNLSWGCTFGGVYVPCIYSHARWWYRRRFRSVVVSLACWMLLTPCFGVAFVTVQQRRCGSKVDRVLGLTLCTCLVTIPQKLVFCWICIHVCFRQTLALGSLMWDNGSEEPLLSDHPKNQVRGDLQQPWFWSECCTVCEPWRGRFPKRGS